jgi:hypothetical protein
VLRVYVREAETRKCRHLEGQNDRSVYDLYDLTFSWGGGAVKNEVFWDVTARDSIRTTRRHIPEDGILVYEFLKISGS